MHVPRSILCLVIDRSGRPCNVLRAVLSGATGGSRPSSQDDAAKAGRCCGDGPAVVIRFCRCIFTNSRTASAASRPVSSASCVCISRARLLPAHPGRCMCRLSSKAAMMKMQRRCCKRFPRQRCARWSAWRPGFGWAVCRNCLLSFCPARRSRQVVVAAVLL